MRERDDDVNAAVRLLVELARMVERRREGVKLRRRKEGEKKEKLPRLN